MGRSYFKFEDNLSVYPKIRASYLSEIFLFLSAFLWTSRGLGQLRLVILKLYITINPCSITLVPVNSIIIKANSHTKFCMNSTSMFKVQDVMNNYLCEILKVQSHLKGSHLR